MVHALRLFAQAQRQVVVLRAVVLFVLVKAHLLCQLFFKHQKMRNVVYPAQKIRGVVDFKMELDKVL